MTFKVKIDCRKCDCSFELTPKFFLLREFAECPNCGQVFPQNDYDNLKAGIQRLGSVPGLVGEEKESDSPFSKPDTGFTLQVKECQNVYPEIDSAT